MNEFRPNYLRVWWTFLRNSLVREMTFRGNFLITIVTRALWFVAQLLMFEIIYAHVDAIKDWSRYEYFCFMATGMMINALVEVLFMPNCANFSELIRTGDLDFVLLKPIDTQFLVSFAKVNLAMLSQVVLAGGLLLYALGQLEVTVTAGRVAMYLLLVGVGVGFFYSLMITLASMSVWMGRNQGLYDFWFYVISFSRYPGSIYRQSTAGEFLWFGFSFILPILLVVTVPARVLLTKALDPNWWVVLVGPTATLMALVAARRIFKWSLNHYRSASS